MGYTSLVQINDPARVILLSWRPEPRNEKLRNWVMRFLKYLTLECGTATIIDVEQAAMDKAAQRDADYTDFVSLVTVDYAFACMQEEDHELIRCLPALRDGVSPICFWAVRLDPGKPQKWTVGKNKFAPWQEESRWHFLPSFEDNFNIHAEDISKPMTEKCVNCISEHQPDCRVCLAALHDKQV
ncbi:hypothetical protein [Massilia sp. S19_KUP03_FR1]|uniref:hypothetical protein n=1 Tax=Massilia sp. S19_KUP03_FR1 TaxID=3025503 RepID=UPI002FCD9382